MPSTGTSSRSADAAAFSIDIRAALVESGDIGVARRVAVADANSWQSRIAVMQRLIDEGIERRASTASGGTRRSAVYRRTRNRIAQAVIGLAAVCLLVFTNPVVDGGAAGGRAPPSTAMRHRDRRRRWRIRRQAGRRSGSRRRAMGEYAPVLILSSAVYSFTKRRHARDDRSGVPTRPSCSAARPARFRMASSWTTSCATGVDPDSAGELPYHMRRALRVEGRPRRQVVRRQEQASSTTMRAAPASNGSAASSRILAIVGCWRRGWL